MKNPEIPYANNIIYNNLIVFGFPGTGKTTLVNSLAGYAIDNYGKNNVTAMFSEKGDLDAIIESFKPKLVNLLYTDNATLAKYSKETLHNYFMLRNITYDKFGVTNGFILSIIALHRYFAIPIEFRTVVDGILIRDISLNPYDKVIIRKLIDNDELYDILLWLTVERAVHRNLMNFSVFVGKTLKGIVSLPPRKNFYFSKPSSPAGMYIPLTREAQIRSILYRRYGK